MEYDHARVYFGVLALGLGWPLGRYLAAVMAGAPMRGDRLFIWLERPLCALVGANAQLGISWRGYAAALLMSNAMLAVSVWVL
jgi:K+-transporting ATPase ATPase A chain